ncbi:MAG: hypothetical protein WBE07_10680, partial [Psychrobacter sp.]
YLLDGLGFKFVTVGSDFLGHDKLLLLCLVYQVYLYGLFSIAHNLSDNDPVKALGFNNEAPNPSCATFESCLFCEFFAIHIDFEDIHKLLSLKEALLKSSMIRDDPEYHLLSIEPSLFRIDEIINILKGKDNRVIELVDDAEQKIKMQIYNEYWDEHINFLTVASESNRKSLSL